MMTYKYKLYRTKRTRLLDAMLREACFVWNHALALQRRYYALYGGYIPCTKMQAHFAKRIKRNLLHCQTTQELLYRLDMSYKRFFSKKSRRPPKFHKAEHFSSIVFKQNNGYKLNSNILVINSIKKHFQFSFSRPYIGKVRIIRIVRDRLGDYYLHIVTDAIPNKRTHQKSRSGALVGADFGLKTFLTLSDGTKISNPLFLTSGLNKLRSYDRALSRCQDGSKHRTELKQTIRRFHKQVCDKRDDWQWKLCHALCRRYDMICIEDLDIQEMKTRWGRKITDLAFNSFVIKLEHIASQYDVSVVKVGRFYPSSKTCNVCQYVNEHLSLRDRHWVCPNCGTSHDRDLNAALNILRQGIASFGSPYKTQSIVQGALSTE